MSSKQQTSLAGRDPFDLVRRMASEFDRVFESRRPIRWSLLRSRPQQELTPWLPDIDVYERDNRLFTKIDLPGLKKEDVTIEVADVFLTISGERKSEADVKEADFYKIEREYGSFYRAVPLPEGVRFEDVKARFSDGVLEVSMPLPPRAATKRRVEIEDAAEQVTAGV